MNMRENFIYLAGIIDGEGCIAVEKKFPSKRKKFPHYYARLTISNINKELMQWISNTFGCKIYKRSIHNKSLGTMPQFQWYVFGKNLDNIIKNICEFSIVKKNQIQNVIEFRKTVGKTGQHVTQEMRDIREKFYIKSRYYNSLHKIPSALSPVS